MAANFSRPQCVNMNIPHRTGDKIDAVISPKEVIDNLRKYTHPPLDKDSQLWLAYINKKRAIHIIILKNTKLI